MNKQIEFLKELKALLEKHEAEIEASVESIGYSHSGVSLSVFHSHATTDLSPQSLPTTVNVNSNDLENIINKLENQNQ